MAQQRLAAALGRSEGSLRLVKPDQIHLTLLFLGQVPETRVPELVEAMNAELRLPAFEVAFGGAGVFPPRGAPRVLWIGVTAGAASLVSLQRAIAGRIGRLGIAFDDRPFHPHLTIGRWREARSSIRVKFPAAAQRVEVARVHVDGATLYRSHLSPAGAAYRALAHATLTQAWP